MALPARSATTGRVRWNCAHCAVTPQRKSTVKRENDHHDHRDVHDARRQSRAASSTFTTDTGAGARSQNTSVASRGWPSKPNGRDSSKASRPTRRSRSLASTESRHSSDRARSPSQVARAGARGFALELVARSSRHELEARPHGRAVFAAGRNRHQRLRAVLQIVHDRHRLEDDRRRTIERAVQQLQQRGVAAVELRAWRATVFAVDWMLGIFVFFGKLGSGPAGFAGDMDLPWDAGEWPNVCSSVLPRSRIRSGREPAASTVGARVGPPARGGPDTTAPVARHATSVKPNSDRENVPRAGTNTTGASRTHPRGCPRP